LAVMSTPNQQQHHSQPEEVLLDHDLTREQWTAILEDEIVTYGYPPLTDDERDNLNELPELEASVMTKEEINYWADFVGTQEIVIVAKMMASIEKPQSDLQSLIQNEFNQIVHFKQDTPEESARTVIFGTALACKKIKVDLAAGIKEIKSFVVPKDFTPQIQRKLLAIVKLYFAVVKLAGLVTNEKFVAGRWWVKTICVEIRILIYVLQTNRTAEEDVAEELSWYLNVLNRT
jgi:hypothetical protein